ncbi:D-hexose-6-phosphate mutarotase [Psychrobacter phenylpyruvicus]|uniref:Putative glucose-6-phosphate 1-epimerase n=1 Tax=Psychrobacter phenylpyruvicus TaxID=29432 RepID=A0A379LMC5_9GAMM|nr:D-hexose-6-phosphate mutarotase [Psychrobacter phenylpyruvicus]SUD91756.1 Putative glucose-6-phosphate 1-epimerase [Psychrobacter phenylpyruvicus]
MLPTLQRSKIDELDAITINGADYRATVLLQGAQLIHFSTKYDSDNWLWVSEKAEYNKGDSVRGGVPICWPVFGQFDANPQAVKDSFTDCRFDLTQHGFARNQIFNIDLFNPLHVDQRLQHFSSLTLSLPNLEDFHPKLGLQVKFLFSAHGFNISLITCNLSEETVNFSQALHTYLPTDDIEQTTIRGFDQVTYSDTLDNWATKTQQGEVTFSEGVDRIYHAAPTLVIGSPGLSPLHLASKGSNSTVVWNPWYTKAHEISQFAADDYKKMLCVETANAHLDYITLSAGESHELVLEVTKIPF